MNLRTAPATMALGLLGLLLLSALSWVVLIGPTVGRLGETAERYTALEDRNLTMAAQLASLKRLAEEVPQLRRDADELMVVMPPTADQPGFFRAVTAAAEEAGLRASALTAVSPGVPVLPTPPPPPPPDPDAETPSAPVEEEVPEIAVQAVSISVNGTYEQLRRLLGGLETMERAVLVQGVDLSSDTESLTLTVTGASFVAAPLAEPPAAG